jgi:ankyrin repeat protein
MPRIGLWGRIVTSLLPEGTTIRRRFAFNSAPIMPLFSRTFSRFLLPALKRVRIQGVRIAQPVLLCMFLASAIRPSPGLAADIRQEDLNSSLIHAAGQGDVSTFNLALSLGANINAVDRNGNNAVLLATQGEQHGMLRLLLDKGVNPNARGASGFTPLTYAALHGLNRDARLLLKAGADPNQHTVVGDAPLHLAVAFRHNDMIAELVGAGARIEDLNGAGETALIVAIRADNRQAFDALLTLGARTSVYDKTGRSALFWAILEDHEAMALALVEQGARFDSLSDGYTPLRMAQIMRHANVAAALAQRGASE